MGVAQKNDGGFKSYGFEDLEIGMEASHDKTITADDIEVFAKLTGDNNPVHMSDDYAGGTIFKERIAHGILTASLLSTVFGTKMPGPGCIYVSQSLNFHAPVKIGDHVVANARVTDLVADRLRAVFACQCLVKQKVVLDGEAVLYVPRRQA